MAAPSDLLLYGSGWGKYVRVFGPHPVKILVYAYEGRGSDYTEKLLRDAIVMPIYEGTSQIQALMAMKDTLGGILKRPQAFVRRMAQARWRSLSASDALERRVACRQFKQKLGQPIRAEYGELLRRQIPVRSHAADC